MKRIRLAAWAVAIVATISTLIPLGHGGRASAGTSGACPAPRCVTGSYQAGPEVLPIEVLLPPGYATSRTHYPVVYDLAGGLSKAGYPNQVATLLAFTQNLPADQQAIFVLPYTGPIGWWSDWLNGSHAYESGVINTVIPMIDADYRTIPDRAHRVVEGTSLGGFGAMEIAARHPDLFVDAASFSGPVDNSDPLWQSILTGATPGVNSYCLLLGASDPANDCTGQIGTTSTVAGITPWGDPATEQVWWRDHDPVTLASNLHGLGLWFASGNGVSCDASDGVGSGNGEAVFRREEILFDQALTTAGVAHTAVYPSCGIHSERYFSQYRAEWWPVMLRTLGRPAPLTWSYRTADPSFSVWGWTFATDPTRAPEFLNVEDASGTGLTLVGSGQVSVHTASIFRPGQLVRLSGADATEATADSTGRISFRVNLGPAHTSQQYTATQQAAETAAFAGYFRTQEVTFQTVQDASQAGDSHP